MKNTSARKHKSGTAHLKTIVLLAVVFFFSLQMKSGLCFSIDVQRLANAIYKAEGGSKTSHPYGILAHYKTTTPRQACINTINHALRDWNGKGDFIEFLGSRYAPIGVANDPGNLNKNWIKNVRLLYGGVK